MWCQMSQEMTVQFYKDIAEALPEMNLLVYDNPEAFQGKISTDAYADLAKIPQVVASKYRRVLAGIATDTLVADKRAVKGNIKLLPHDCDWYYAARWYPEEIDGCWSSGVSAGPAPVVALKKAINAGDWQRAKQITDDISWAYENFFPEGSFIAFHTYNIGIQKARFDAVGYIKAGPPLPPYHVMPNSALENAKECGRRWKDLQKEYSG